jgi:hypothetical protein
METHIFKLLSGVECEVRELTGKHQRILTEQKNKNLNDNLNNLLTDVIVRVGSKRNVDLQFVKKMLACDRKKILVEVRQFTMGFDPKLEFTYDYVDVNNSHKKHPVFVDLSSGFEEKPLFVKGEDDTLIPASYIEYDSIQREIEVVLPSGKKVGFYLLDGVGEELATNISKNSMSSHTALLMRRPYEFHQGPTDIIPINLNLDSLKYKDIEFLRTTIKQYEGRINTELSFEHPEAHLKPQNEKNIIVDLLGITAFFFPSEAI